MYDIHAHTHNFCVFFMAFILIPNILSVLQAHDTIPGGMGTTIRINTRPLCRVSSRHV